MRKLLIFLKEPVVGRVKTRLVPSIGQQGACEVYRACVELTLERLSAWRSETILCIDPPEALERMRGSVGSSWTLWPQRGADLGERLAAATDRAFGEGAEQVVVIGTDSPWLRHDDVLEAFDALQQADVVLGPTEDGGYYLMGLARRMPEIFDGVAWSTDAVYRQTEVNANALRLTTWRLRMGYDVDRLEDVAQFVAEERDRGMRVPRGVEVIERIVQDAIEVSGRKRCRN